jgi:peroxiredoxin/uncharacterized membrane protein YphA (DoxX/SURF4 family)
MDVLIFATRMALALVFAVAGFTKLADRPGTEKAVIDFGAPQRFARPVATLLSFAEFAAALLLMFRGTARWGSFIALALLLIFTLAISYNLWKGRRPDCNCFGQLHSAPIGRGTLVRNGVLLLLAGWIAWQGPDQPGLTLAALFTNVSIWAFLAVLASALVIVIVALQSWFMWNLLRQNGRLIQRMEALETRLGIGSAQVGASSSPAQPMGLPVGSPAPGFSLPQLDNANLSLEALRSGDKPALLLFSDPNCGPCNTLMPTAALWQRQYASTLRIVVISSGSLETNRIRQQEYGLTDVLLQKDREVAELYQAYGTPSAVLVRSDGTIGSALAPGAEAISALVTSAIDGTREQQSNLPIAGEPDYTPNDLSELGEDDLLSWFNWVDFWSGPLSYENQQSDVRLAIRDNCGIITGQMYSVDPLNGQIIEMGQITGTRTDNRLNLVTHTGLQITADLTMHSLVGQVVFPERYGEASITSQFTLAPSFTAFLPRLLRVQG